MRSLLIAEPQLLDRVTGVEADALVVDLPPLSDPARCAAVAEFITARTAAGPPVYGSIPALDWNGCADANLDTLVPARPAGILLRNAGGGADLMRLSAMLAAREALAGLPDGAIRILAVIGTAAGMLAIGSCAGATARLSGLAWDADALAASLGLEAPRNRDGIFAEPLRIARALCVAAAAAAGVPAIDTAFPDPPDLSALRKEAIAARRDGFAGKIAASPDQVVVINAAFGRAATPLAASST